MQLRANVRLQTDRAAGGRSVVLLVDERTRRYFALPDEVRPLLELLRAPRGIAELLEQLEGALDEDAITQVVEQLRSQHLLDDGCASETLHARVREDHLAQRWRSMKRALTFAAQHVPVYQTKLAGIDPSALREEADLARLPTTIKDDVRASYPAGFVPDTHDLQELTAADLIVRAASSGTSAGDRLQTIHTREAWRRQMIAGAMLNQEVFRHVEAKNATFTSMHCADPDMCVTHLARMEDRIRAGTKLILLPPEDPGSPTVEEIRSTLGELRAHETRWVDCNPTYMAALTYGLIDAGIEPLPLAVLTTGFELLSAIHRRLLRTVWGCNVYDRYSASELGNFVALECEHGSHHFNDRYYFAEVVRDGRHARPGEIGHIVVSTLQEMLPLVRYDTRDLAVAAAFEPCPCGSANTRVAQLCGRKIDILVARDGTARTARDVDAALSGVEGLRFYQVAQDASGACTVKVVAEPTVDPARVRERAREALREVIGERDVRGQTTKRIYPEGSGKFRFVRTEVPGADDIIRIRAPSSS